MYRNTELLSLMAERLSSSDRMVGMAPSQALYLPLFGDAVTPSTLREMIMDRLGRFSATRTASLVICYSQDSGYTLEGPSWQEIRGRTGKSAASILRMISERITDYYMAAHGWEDTLNQDIASLELASLEREDNQDDEA